MLRPGCRDLDECTEGGKKCGENTDCINTDGGHHCVCQVGFGGDPCKILFGNDFTCFDLPSDDECKDLDECQLFQSGSVNLDYRHPTFRNLPGDTWKESSYSPQPCSAEESCINLVYKDGIGFKCVPKDQTYAALAIGGLNWNSEVDVLKADLKRCDGIIPEWRTKGTYMHVVIFPLNSFAFQNSRKTHCLNECFQLKYPSGCHATQISPCLRWLYLRGQQV